jgi:ABC-2 type transport system permease protein
MKAGFMSALSYRATVLLVSVVNFAYIAVIYFLWKAIYADSGGVINGMSFEQAFTYLAMASTIFYIYKTFVDGKISADIVSGNIIIDIVRPIDYQAKVFFSAFAAVLSRIIWAGVPVFLLVIALVGPDVFVLKNLMYFFAAFTASYVISFQFDYITGLASFYTESIWGVSMTKESVVLLLSGAVVPVAFFPDSLRPIVAWTPFHHIYNTPLTILTSKTLEQSECLGMIISQCAWIVVIYILSRLVHGVAVKQLTVNGG